MIAALESDRLRVLRDYDILDTAPEEVFDCITRLTRDFFGTPYAYLALLDHDRQWLKACLGDLCLNIPRSQSICTETIAADEPLIIPDLSNDPRFGKMSYVVGPPFLRFYAGAPLKARGGHNIGTLCCVDVQPRTLTSAQVASLVGFAKLTVEAIELRSVATTDHLTGFMTRRAFMEAAERDIEFAQRNRRPLSCVMIDIDRFKTINDTHGHAGGDDVLRRFATLCRNKLRSSDYVGRLGGEEFCILMRETSVDVATEVAERLREGIQREVFAIGRAEWRATASFGVATTNASARSAEQIISCADAALGAAKKAGRNQVQVFGSHSHLRLIQNEEKPTDSIPLATQRSGVNSVMELTSCEIRTRFPESSVQDASPAEPSNVLIVEDDFSTSNALASVVEGAGLEPFQIMDLEGIRSFAAASPCLIILDVALRNCDAVDIIQHLHHVSFPGLVQLVSGSKYELLEEIRLLGEERGLNMLPVMHKPVLQDQVERVISQAVIAQSAMAEIKPFQAVRPKVTLRKALDAGWVEVWYQPKYDVASRTIVGAECLCRVRHPELGVLAPGAFLPGAGALDMAALTELVLRRACADWSAFEAADFPLRLAINIPGPLLIELPLVKLLRELAPARKNWPGLVFEVTEGEALKDLEAVKEVGTQLKIYGVSLSIDDFGMGYSSLGRLREIPFQEIKLDRTLVHGCAADPVQGALCRSAIDLAHSFKSKVVAEGVELEEDLVFLDGVGCDKVQGYLLARPMPRDLLLDLLIQGRV